MTDALGGSLFKDLLPGLLSLPIEILVIGKGSQEYGSLFTELTNKHGHRMYIVPDTKGDRAKMYAASDMALFLTDPSNTPEVADCLANGAIPIAPNCKALSNYNPVQESGNSFIFDETDVWHAFAAIVRAVETHRFPFDWRTIQKHCMGSV
jgi:glycogen synthase